MWFLFSLVDNHNLIRVKTFPRCTRNQNMWPDLKVTHTCQRLLAPMNEWQHWFTPEGIIAGVIYSGSEGQSAQFQNHEPLSPSQDLCSSSPAKLGSKCNESGSRRIELGLRHIESGSTCIESGSRLMNPELGWLLFRATVVTGLPVYQLTWRILRMRIIAFVTAS